MRIRNGEVIPVVDIINPPFTIFLLLKELLLVLLAHSEGHHAPGQILHAMLVGKLHLGAGEEFPNLSSEGIFLLHLLDALIRVRKIILHRRKYCCALKGIVGGGEVLDLVDIDFVESITGGALGVVIMVARMHVAVRRGRPEVGPSRKAKIVFGHCWVHGVYRTRYGDG